MNPKSLQRKHGGKLWLGLCVWLLLSFGAASMGALFTPGNWYAGLVKPSWNPPAWLFGPVWTVLYILMAVAAWLVWQHGGFSKQRRPLRVYLVQLFLNAAWTPLFFGLQEPALAFFEIVILWVAILTTTLLFFRTCRLAAILLVPYLAWVTFAAALNFTLWRLNS